MKENLLQLEITTDRLILRPVSMAERDSIFREFTPEITRFMMPLSAERIEDTEKFINDSKQKMANGEEVTCAVFEKSSGEFLGTGGIHRINTSTPELGIWIKKSAHGNRYGREAVAGFKKWADENLVYEYIIYPVFKENIPSRKIAESLGGKLAGESEKKTGAGVNMTSLEYRIYRN